MRAAQDAVSRLGADVAAARSEVSTGLAEGSVLKVNHLPGIAYLAVKSSLCTRLMKIRRELAAKERAEVNKRKAEQLRQKREESEVQEATGRRDAPVCARPMKMLAMVK